LALESEEEDLIQEEAEEKSEGNLDPTFIQKHNLMPAFSEFI